MATTAAAPQAPITVAALARRAGNSYQSTRRMLLAGKVRVPTVTVGAYLCIPPGAVAEAVRQVRRLMARRRERREER